MCSREPTCQLHGVRGLRYTAPGRRGAAGIESALVYRRCISASPGNGLQRFRSAPVNAFPVRRLGYRCAILAVHARFTVALGNRRRPRAVSTLTR